MKITSSSGIHKAIYHNGTWKETMIKNFNSHLTTFSFFEISVLL